MTDPFPRPSNRLANETSAYLRQHMHNPVDWFPWGPEALERARTEDKPLLVSIGYSACHWCHVMEHESFEDPSTAALMNRLFVCIKVDREERPDVDQLYMDTVTGLTGHGGWPLTVFCTPDGKPFHGGTYYPPEPRQGMPSFQQVLNAVDEAYRGRRDQVWDSARQITEALGKRPEGTADALPGAATTVQAAYRMLQRVDPANGGFGTAPKFPTPTSLDVLLAGIDVLPPAKGQEALDHVRLTCVEMARNGLWDHLAGGFHRYRVDAHWRIPHFEKMLYDQGQLIRSYAEAYRRSADPPDDLVWPVLETVAFLRSEMQAEDGGWFASLDADSEGREGKFYVWTPEQIQAVLDDRAAAFCSAYGVSERGNFEDGTTHLHDLDRGPRGEFAAERAALLAARADRIRPGTDRKRVVSWNALTISGLARASSVFADASLLADAEAAADFVMARMRDDEGRLLRVYDGGRAHVLAFLDDHATLLEAFLDLYRTSADPRHIESASALADAIAARFYDADERDFYLTPSDGEALAQRPRSDHDGAMPHSTGLATLGLLRVATLTGRSEWRRIAEDVLRTHAYPLERAPEAYPTLARAALAAERGLSLAVIVGAEGAARDALAAAARNALTPEDAVVVAAPGEAPAGVDPSWLHERGPIDDAPAAYVCRGVSCSLPVTDPRGLEPLATAP